MRLRFLLFALLAALLPLALALTATGDVQLRAVQAQDDRVTAASSALSSRLEGNAARRRELLLRLAALGDVTAPVREANDARQAPRAEAVARLRAAVADLFPRDTPELLAVATAQGAQVVVTSGEPQPVDAADLPLVQAALGGQTADTLALFKGELFHFAATPVGVADGALIVGDRLGDSSATRLRDLVRAEVSFVAGGKVVASSLREPARTEILVAAERRNSTERTGRLELGLPGLGFLDGRLPVPALAASHISLGREAGGGVVAVVTNRSDLGWLGRLQAFALAFALGTLAFGALWAQSLIWGPVRRQARSIESHLVRLRAERSARLGAKGFSPPFDELALEVDRLAATWSGEAPSESAPLRAPTVTDATPRPIQRPPVALPLAPAPAEEHSDQHEGTPSAFPFADDLYTKTGRNKTARAPASMPEPQPPARVAAASLDPVVPPTPPSTPSIAELLKPRSEPKAEPRPAAVVAMPVESDVGGPIPLPPPRPTNPSLAAVQPSGAPKDPFAAFGPSPVVQKDDRTREAAIPADLLERSRELEAELLEPAADPDEEHFRQVFDDFVATRKKCGEPPDAGLTLERFTQRLKKNREQLVQKYNCRSVRFQVYVKEGKAAVKAAPVR